MVADRLSLVFGALADPTRRAILARLADGEATVAELAAPFAMSQPAVSKHLAMLKGAALPVLSGSPLAAPKAMVGIDSVPNTCCHSCTRDQVKPPDT